MSDQPETPDARTELANALQEALSHLYDPEYDAPEALFAATGCDKRQGLAGLRTELLRRIGTLAPPPETPPGAPVRAIHELLHNRYALGLTQEQTAEQMNVSIATAWRLQRRAISHLAGVLLEDEPASAVAPEPDPAPDWQAQAQQELAALRASAPDAVAPVAEAIEAVRELGPALTGGRDLHLTVGHLQPGLTASVHPSALRQMLTSAVRRLARYTAAAEITLFAGLEGGSVRVTLTAPVNVGGDADDHELIADIVAPANTTIGAQIEGDHAFVWIEMPSPGSVAVLVVDDNRDMAELFQRAAAGTNYRILHISGGSELAGAIERARPDIIVLDVMLPDIDGWRLLMRLHEDLETRSIPVIICSVVRDEELALSLGARLYLPKPVRPHEFIAALDRVAT